MQTDNEASQETEAKSVAQPDPEEEARRKKAERIARRRRERAKRDIESGEIMPTAEDATMKPRHWGVLFSFFLLVAAPIAVLGYYMMGVAVEQYASTAGFSVRKEDVKSPAEVLGGIGSFLGGSGSGETDMLFEYIQSQELVAAIDDKLDLVAHYSAPYDVDPIFALNPDSSIEDLLVYWGRIVRITYDNGTGLMNLRVLAFTPEMAQNLAAEIISESQILVNQLNAQARSDSLGYAEQDLADAVARLKAAREALVAFRSRTQIVDPQSDLQGQMGILNSLQAQLAEALIELDLIVQEALPGDPRVTQAQRRIEVIRERIDEERLAYTNDEGPNGMAGYPVLLAEYESLIVDREFAEQTYRAALGGVDIARANAARQSRYLATYIHPTFAEQAEFPQRWLILGVGSLFIFLSWIIGVLVYYAIRDRQ